MAKLLVFNISTICFADGSMESSRRKIQRTVTTDEMWDAIKFKQYDLGHDLIECEDEGHSPNANKRVFDNCTLWLGYNID